jgi:hypothetical protein
MNQIADMIRAIGDELTAEDKDATEYFPTTIVYVDDEVFVAVTDVYGGEPSWWVCMVSPIDGCAVANRASEDDMADLAEVL